MGIVSFTQTQLDSIITAINNRAKKVDATTTVAGLMSSTDKTKLDSVASEITWTVNDTRAKTALNASGTAPIYACRAWVNFNGTGTVAIRASGNVSSITDSGTGTYTVNFTTNMPDANYSVCATNDRNVDGVATVRTLLASSFVIANSTGVGTLEDRAAVYASIFR